MQIIFWLSKKINKIVRLFKKYFNKLIIFMEQLNIIIEIFLKNPLAQWIWLIAFLVSAYNFSFAKWKKFIFFTAIASFFWALHFIFLGLGAEESLKYWLISAWLINFFDIFKNLFSLKYEKNLQLVILISLFYLIIWIFSYNWILSLIPTTTAILSTFLVFYIRSIYLNIWFLFITFLWMIFNYFSASIWGLMTDIFLFVFGSFGIIRTIIIERNRKLILVKEEIKKRK